MLIKDLKVGDFASYEIVFMGKRYKFISRVEDYRNGKSNVLAYCERENVLKRVCVRITELFPLEPFAERKISQIPWESLTVKPLPKMNKVHFMLGLDPKVNSNSVGVPCYRIG